jgi:hypothetical protein
MYTVRAKSGRSMGSYATKAEAEARRAQLDRQSERLKAHRFGRGRTSRSPSEYRSRWVSEIHELLKRGGYAGDLQKHAERLVREGYGPEEIAHRIRNNNLSDALGIQMVKKGYFLGNPIHGPARKRLLKIHADVSRKLWAKSPQRTRVENAAYAATHKDYRLTRPSGEKCVLVNGPHGTTVVALRKMTAKELASYARGQGLAPGARSSSPIGPVTLEQAIEKVLEKHLGHAWKAGMFDRSDEPPRGSAAILVNIPGFSENYARLLRLGYRKSDIANEIYDYGFGMGMWHPLKRNADHVSVNWHKKVLQPKHNLATKIAADIVKLQGR